MTAKHMKSRLPFAAMLAFVALLANAGGAQATAPPIKLVLSSHIASGFEFPESVAADNDPKSAEYGHVYVADQGNYRVQELTAAGAFVAMFGWEVNATKDEESGATQAAKNLCTAASKDTCKAGMKSSAAEAFEEPQDVTVDPSTGDIYVLDQASRRVDEYTAEGQFVLMMGKEVNETKDTELGASETEKNVCVAESKDTCKTGEQAATGSPEHGAFDVAQFTGNLLAVGGPENLLYVGDEHSVQEFKTDGTWVGEISLASISSEPNTYVTALALDQATGDLYLVYGSNTNVRDIVRDFDPSDKELANFQVSSREANKEVTILGLALDSSGHLAVSARETNGGGHNDEFGSLYAVSSGRRVTGFTIPDGVNVSSLAFDSKGSLYMSDTAAADQDILAYTAEPVEELVVNSSSCSAGAEHGTSATFDCTLNGEANPEGISEAEALFEWGRTESLGEVTPGQKVEEPQAVAALIEGVRPNQTLYYQLAGYDHNVQLPEQLTSEKSSLTAPMVAPKILGEPSASFITSSSAILSGQLNPENTITSYAFRYARMCDPEEVCPGIAQTPGMLETTTLESAAYGRIGAAVEASGLQPQTTYRFQMIAVNQGDQAAVNEAGGATIPEGTFTTEPAPVPQVSSGGASAIGSTSATIVGSVDPDGLPATYSFEAGVYDGVGTRYGVVFSGLAGTGRVPLEESVGLTGLQPGTTYAYRIAIHSGYIHNGESTLRSAPTLFTTTGIPELLAAPVPLPQLLTPHIAFPSRARVGRGGKTKVKRKKKAKRKKLKGHAKKGPEQHANARAPRTGRRRSVTAAR
jgi:hypothetical protein